MRIANQRPWGTYRLIPVHLQLQIQPINHLCAPQLMVKTIMVSIPMYKSIVYSGAVLLCVGGGGGGGGCRRGLPFPTASLDPSPGFSCMLDIKLIGPYFP